jgi:phage tail-like protein
MADRNDPYTSFRFKVSIDEVGEAGFSEVNGLSTDTTPIEYRNGDAAERTVSKIPGLHKFSNITLKRGFTSSDALWKWRQSVLDGKTKRSPGTIILQDEEGKPALTWKFEQGWPSKWEGPSMDAKGDGIAIETLEIACEKIEWQG